MNGWAEGEFAPGRWQPPTLTLPFLCRTGPSIAVSSVIRQSLPMIELNQDRPPLPPWTLITSHGLVLLYVAAHGDATIREMSENLELTERRIADLIRDLSKAGLVEVTRNGRRNSYSLDPEARFRHPFVASIPFSSFLDLWQDAARRDAAMFTLKE